MKGVILQKNMQFRIVPETAYQSNILFFHDIRILFLFVLIKCAIGKLKEILNRNLFTAYEGMYSKAYGTGNKSSFRQHLISPDTHSIICKAYGLSIWCIINPMSRISDILCCTSFRLIFILIYVVYYYKVNVNYFLCGDVLMGIKIPLSSGIFI